ncbi:protein TMED8 isoform X2 [Vombatus ursinus]|uniref:Transmembrane p24 trafficking protein family member 8 n=1 Tax=Vombatus ursinus TaxID=29139 RepID=A0A4X2LHX2_VOMUR|nr:protein TMED8 isoform X2 [Vombatus ursinus]
MSDSLLTSGSGFLNPAGDGVEAGAGAGGCPAPVAENEDTNHRTSDIASSVMTASDQEPSSSPRRPQIVSSVTEDVAENPGKGDGALKEQASVGQEPLSGDQLLKEMSKYQAPKGSGDVVMIQSDTGDTGTVDALSTELESADLLGEQRRVSTPPLSPPSIWTFAKMKEFKTKMSKVKNSRLVVKRGEVVTVRVPTHPDGKRLFWEFATDNYDIGFGVYFDWTPVTSTAVTVHVSESSDEDEDDEEDGEGGIEGLVPIGDVEMGSKSSLRNRYGEIMPVYRRDSHRDVQAGCHDYPGEGIYLLKFDNSYSLLRNKTLYYHVYYTS